MASEGIIWICTIAITGIILMHVGVGAAGGTTDPCNSYKELNDEKRDIAENVGSLCDKDLKPGWYRFHIDGESAIIPTSCVKPGKCGTAMGMWVNLKGNPMPEEGHTISAVTCAAYSILEHWSCCALQQDIKIRHCPGNFYIYHLKPTDRCPVSYCAMKNTTQVESHVTVRHGYHISYIETTTMTEPTTQQIETTQSLEATTIQFQDDTTIRMNLTTEEEEINGTQMNTEETQQMDLSTLPAIDEEQERLKDLFSSGADSQYDPDTPQITSELSTSSVMGKTTTIQSVVISGTTRSSVIDKTRPNKRRGQPAELIFPLNGHDRDEVLANFRVNFTAAMKKANGHIDHIIVKELCPIGDAVRILFWAYDKNGNPIPGNKVERNMEMRATVEKALGLQPHTQRQDIFQEYLALFIILIIIGFLCLIILLSSCMYLYCRRHSGHWDRALAEQYHVTVVPRREARVAESPYSDEAIMSDEILEKSHSSLGSHYPGVGNLHDLSYPNSLSGIKAMNNKNSFNTYPNSYGSLPKDGIEGLVVPIDQLNPEKDALIIEDTVL